MANYSNYATYIEKAENGARINFNYRDCQLVDVIKDETISYFLLFFPEGEEPHFMELTPTEAFELLATYYHTTREHKHNDTFYQIMDHAIEEILYSAKE